MDADDIERVAVLGAGSMGHGIAEVVALAGYSVTLRDIKQEIVEQGIESIRRSLDTLAENDDIDHEEVLDRIEPMTDLERAVSDVDLVIEAAPERMELKQEIFSQLDAATAETILATNTSSLSITDIASATERPERVIGMHFFNPPVMMDLVEVIYGERTSDETADLAYSFAEDIGKTPIYVHKDVRGFVVNSVLGPFLSEPAWMVSNGEATIEQADAAMVQRGYPMGPFELGDLTGIDVGYHVRREADQPIPPIMEERFEAGEYGRKTGSGYYEYDEGEGDGDGDGPTYEEGDGEGFDTLRVEARMINEAASLVGNDVATAEAIDTGMRLGAGFPDGICRKADSIGLDTVLEKLRTVHENTNADRFDPAKFLIEHVEAGNTGRDAEKGFYEYKQETETENGQQPAGLDRSYETINYAFHDDGLLEIELDRPERLNALSAGLRDDAVHLLTTIDADDVRCLTIEGAGDRAFCAGADITGFEDVRPTDVKSVSKLHETVAAFPRPTIAKIDGYCLGGGNELALACDLRIATERSEFGQPEINLGLIPGGGATQRLLRMIGEARAKELVFRGNHISAVRAAEWGMINRAVPAEVFEDTVSNFVSDIVDGPPIALEIAKSVMDEGGDADLDTALSLESQGFGLLIGTDDVAEGTAAFAEQRDPEFEGR